jgi:hypothetical protein
LDFAQWQEKRSLCTAGDLRVQASVKPITIHETCKGGKTMLKTMALIFGIVFILVGAAGFVPGLVHQPITPHQGTVMMHESAGNLLGIFPVNMLHNIVHLLFGIIGLAASRSVGGARGYFKFVFIAYALLAVLGLIPATQTMFGLVPIHGNDVWLHAVLALAGLYFGFIHKETAVDRR